MCSGRGSMHMASNRDRAQPPSLAQPTSSHGGQAAFAWLRPEGRPPLRTRARLHACTDEGETPPPGMPSMTDMVRARFKSGVGPSSRGLTPRPGGAAFPVQDQTRVGRAPREGRLHVSAAGGGCGCLAQEEVEQLVLIIGFSAHHSRGSWVYFGCSVVGRCPCP